jgi:hypothetical protein
MIRRLLVLIFFYFSAPSSTTPSKLKRSKRLLAVELSLTVHPPYLLRSRSATVFKRFTNPRRMPIQLPFVTTQLSLHHFGCEIFSIRLTCFGDLAKE